MKDKRRYYLAYGSNLNLEQMKKRCPDSKPVAAIVLRGWKLEFRGVLTIVRSTEPDAAVFGALYRISARDEKALDVYEGFPVLYRKQSVKFQTLALSGEAFFYVMNRGSLAPPTSRYYDTVRQGFIDWDLPLSVLDQAVNEARLSLLEKVGGIPRKL